MINLFLRIKAIFLFFFVVLLPGVYLSYMMNIGEKIKYTEGVPLSEEAKMYYTIALIVIVIALVMIFSWQYALGIGLQRMLPKDAKMSTLRFKIFFYIPIIYFSLGALMLYLIFSGQADGESVLATIVSIIIVFAGSSLILPTFLSLIHTYFFIAKTVKSAELQREATFSEYGGLIMTVWIYPLGFFIIQPKVNELAKKADGLNI